MKPVFETTRRISSQLSEAYRGKISRLGGAVIATAYVLAKMQQNPSARIDSLEAFLSDNFEDKEVASVLSRNLDGLWETAIKFH